MTERSDENLIDRAHIMRSAQAGLNNSRRLAWKIPLIGLASLAGLELLIGVCISLSSMPSEQTHDLAWAGVAMFFGIGFWLTLGLRMLVMRDVRQIERLIKHGVPHRAAITSRKFIAESPLGGASNMTVAWSENGQEVSARMNDRTDVLNGPVERDVVVLTRGHKRWVGVVVGDNLLLALRPPREYHIFGGNNA
ncbi:MAG: hypothetical protein ABJE66_29380 [Deltaproteobacteria bacterium]